MLIGNQSGFFTLENYGALGLISMLQRFVVDIAQYSAAQLLLSYFNGGINKASLKCVVCRGVLEIKIILFLFRYYNFSGKGDLTTMLMPSL